MTCRSVVRACAFTLIQSFLFAASVFADTSVGGRISADTVWTLANSPYLVTSTVQVYGTTTTPVTLTIQPGVTVKFNSGAGLQIGSGSNLGALIAQGTSGSHITFTRSGISGSWAGITFNSSTVSSTTIVQYVDIQYSSGIVFSTASPTLKDSTITNVANGYSALNIGGACSPNINNVTMTNNSTYGIYLTSSSPVITGGSLTNTSGHGIYGTGSPVVSNFTISIPATTGIYGAYFISTTSGLSITNSTVGGGLYIGNSNSIAPAITGNTFANFDQAPLHAGANGIGDILNSNTFTGMSSASRIEVIGENINHDTQWKKWAAPYVIVSGNPMVYKDATTAATLTIDPGVTVKFPSAGYFYIGYGSNKGALIARGTITDRIALTRSGTSGTWGGLVFQDGTIDGTTIVEYADIQYCTGVTMTSASPTIKDSSLTNITGTALSLTTSNPTLENVTVVNDGAYSISLTSSSPTISGGSLTNTNASGYGIYGTGSPVLSNLTVAITNIAGRYGAYFSTTTSGLSITNSTIGNGLYIATTGITPAITGNTFTNSDQSPLHVGANIVGDILNGNTVTGMTPAGRIEVAGETMNRDALWKNWAAPYLILSTVSVAKNSASAATLTIQPGASVKFNAGTGLQVGDPTNKGVLSAVGAAAAKIRFTSSSATPAPGNWTGITFSGAGASASVLENAVVEYGGYGANYPNANIALTASGPAVRKTTSQYSAGSGIYVQNVSASPSIDSCTISNNKWGVYSFNSNPVVSNTIITGNTTAGVTNANSSTTVDARNSWWGSSTGPTHSGNPGGTGSVVSDYVLYSPWLTQQPGTSSVTISDTRATPSSLNPDGDFTAISATISEASDWTIIIADGNLNQVRHLSGTGVAVSSRWYGENDQGQKVADGAYYYWIDAYSTAWGVHASSSQGLLMVSRQLPIAVFTQPADGQMFAARSTLSVTGTAADPADFYKYTLEYGSGANPTSWHMLKISTATVANGLLYSWDTSGLAAGVYTLRLSVTDLSNNTAVETASLRLIAIQDQSVSETFFSPNGDGVKDATTFSASVNYPSAWTVSIKNGSGTTVRSYTAAGASLNQAWDGKDGSGAVVPDGAYTYQIDATSTETSVAALPATGTITVDTTSPVAQITAPAPNAVLWNTVPITGTASDLNLDNYKIEYGPPSGSGPWTLINTGAASVSSGALATWITNDGTNSIIVPNGSYLLRLTATDKAGNSSVATVPVSTDNLILSNISASSHALDTFSAQSSVISFTVNKPATVMLKVIPEKQGPSGTPVYQAGLFVTSAGSFSFTWGGRTNAGVVVPDEAYIYVLEADDGTKTDSYSPPQPAGTGTVTCSNSTDFDLVKNIPMTVTYTPAQPCRLNINIAWWLNSFTMLNMFPATAETHTYVWDGRTPDNKLLDLFAHAACSVASLLRENFIITTGDAPAISALKTDPYALSLSYGQFTKIRYTLSRDSNVTIRIVSPSGATVTPVSGQLQTAGPQELIWYGADPAASGTAMPVSEEGDYMVSVQAVNPSTGTSSTTRANLKIGY